MSVAEPMREPSYPVEPLEWCNRAGAEALRAKIEAYWRERGHAVQTHIERNGFLSTMRTARFDVRSDMRNGYPRLRALPSPEQEP